VWRPAAAARNRRLGRSGTPPARHYDLAARSSLHVLRRKCRRRKRGPGPKIARVERREASPPITRWASRLTSATVTSAPLGAPPPLIGRQTKVQQPGAKRAAAMKVAVPMAGEVRQASGRAASGRFSGKYSMGPTGSPLPGRLAEQSQPSTGGAGQPHLRNHDERCTSSPRTPLAREETTCHSPLA